MFTPPIKRNLGLIDIAPTLEIWINPERIAKYFGCPVELVRKKLDFGSRLQTADVPRWIENLRSLFTEK